MARQIYRQVSLDRLSSPDRLDELMQITNPQGWMIILVIWALLAGLVIWAFAGKITESFQSTGTITTVNLDTVAMFTASISDAQFLTSGQEVEIQVSSFASQEYGYIIGTVEAVQVTDETNAIATITVWLEKADTPTGFKWTVGDGPDTTLYDGTPVSAKFILSEERPIGRVFPGLGAYGIE